MRPSLRRRGAIALAAVYVALASAQTSTATATLRLSGNFEEPAALGIADLRRLPAHKVHDASRADSRAQPAASVRHYTGCLLRDVVAAAKPVEKKPRDLCRSYIVAAASDGYEVVFSWAELFISPVGDGVFVVYEQDGRPLADGEGPIALVATDDSRPLRHVKWLHSLRLQAAAD